MAILGTKQTTKAFTPQNRTRFIEISIPYGQLPSLRAHREVVNVDDEGNVLDHKNSPEVNRKMEDVAAESFTCKDGTKISLPNLAEALSSLIDKWETEDLAAKGV